MSLWASLLAVAFDLLESQRRSFRREVKRTACRLSLLFVMCVTALSAVGFGVASAFLAMLPLGAPLAALLTAAGLAAVAMILAAILALIGR